MQAEDADQKRSKEKSAPLGVKSRPGLREQPELADL